MTELTALKEQTIDKETEKSEDPRLEDYTVEFLKRFAEEFPEFTHEQKIKAMKLSREFALQKIEAEDSADNDKLTGCLSKQGFYKTVDLKLRQYHRETHGEVEKIGQIQTAILLIDMDDLKTLNDTHGHMKGDQVLSVAGQLLRANLRPSDIVGRFGGDEFAALLDRVGLESAIEVAERIRTDFTQTMKVFFPNLEWPKTVSIGVAKMPAVTPEQLESEPDRLTLIKQSIDRADTALYKGAKKVGKDRVGVMIDNDSIQTAIVNKETQGQPTTITYRQPL